MVYKWSQKFGPFFFHQLLRIYICMVKLYIYVYSNSHWFWRISHIKTEYIKVTNVNISHIAVILHSRLEFYLSLSLSRFSALPTDHKLNRNMGLSGKLFFALSFYVVWFFIKNPSNVKYGFSGVIYIEIFMFNVRPRKKESSKLMQQPSNSCHVWVKLVHITHNAINAREKKRTENRNSLVIIFCAVLISFTSRCL